MFYKSSVYLGKWTINFSPPNSTEQGPIIFMLLAIGTDLLGKETMCKPSLGLHKVFLCNISFDIV